MLIAIRIPLVLIWVIFSTTCGIIVSLFRPFNPKNVKVTTDLLKYGSYILGIKLILRHREIADENRPCVFVSNHQDNLDIFPGAFCLPERTVSIGKKNILWIPFFGIYYWLSGNILINRKNKRSAFETMDIAANAIKEKSISVWIMPEGTRSRGRGLLPFKKGPFITAIKAGVPVVPYAWSNYVKHVNLNRWDAGTILMEILPPVPTTGLTVMDATELKDRIHKMMAEAIERLDAEVKIMYRE
ncbi:MAG: 1-acylglycerol-3-phosphate O-acyltransferase [Bacteriovorax sp.]|nr:1-acylglycerol-3-phosphate O-acyltransferase [Bacteriovorax sp.]